MYCKMKHNFNFMMKHKPQKNKSFYVCYRHTYYSFFWQLLKYTVFKLVNHSNIHGIKLNRQGLTDRESDEKRETKPEGLKLAKS